MLKKKSKKFFFYKIIIISYANTQIAQNEIDKLTKIEQNNFEYQRAKNFEKEYKKLKDKHKKEKDELDEKIKNGIEQFNREKIKNEENITLKYKNKIRDIENNQKNEMKN